MSAQPDRPTNAAQHQRPDSRWLLGFTFESPEVQAVVHGWGELDWIDDEELQKARTDRRLSLMNEELGLYLFFTTAECYTRRYGMPKSNGWLVLARVVFFLDFGNGFSPFQGQLPMGVAASDNLETITQRISRPVQTWSAGNRVHKARWLTDRLDVDISFTSGGAGIRLISITPEHRHTGAAQAALPMPTPAQFVDLFGTPLSALQRRPDMAVFELFKRSAEIGTYGEADCSAETGVELYFKPGGEIDRGIYPGPDTSEPCLSGLRYRVDLDFKSTGYAGPLPNGLDFDDPVAVVMAKLDTPPMAESFGGRDGYQRWRLARTDLHVLYSQLEDRIYRITLLAHGCYE